VFGECRVTGGINPPRLGGRQAIGFVMEPIVPLIVPLSHLFEAKWGEVGKLRKRKSSMFAGKLWFRTRWDQMGKTSVLN
jgi:hypothetical protein